MMEDIYPPSFCMQQYAIKLMTCVKKIRRFLMLDCLAVGLGGFIGSVGRYLMGKIPIKNPTSFPVNTFLINIAGVFIIGCIVALAVKNNNISTRIILFLKVGICGGFTTFSTFSLETSELIKSGDTFTALVYVIASVVLGVFAVILPQCIIR